MRYTFATTTALAAIAFCGAAAAQVPADLAAANRAIGKRTDPEGTAKLYWPVSEKPPYNEAKIARDIAYGPDPKNVLDVFQPVAGGAKRPVVIYISGGEGTRIEHRPQAELFYDNVMLWAVKNGMVGVNTDRRAWQNMPWDTGARDVAAMVAWVRANIGKYGGDPDRIFFLGHAFGATQLTTYLAHPEFWGGPKTGLKGALLLSAPFNVAPVIMPTANRATNPMFDPSHSNLEGLKALDLPLYLGSSEYDDDSTAATAEALRIELCKRKCPGHAVFKDHQHISTMFSFNTADRSVSDPVLQWIRGVR